MMHSHGSHQNNDLKRWKVLILVVMDDALAPLWRPYQVAICGVLILVVMDDALAPLLKAVFLMV